MGVADAGAGRGGGHALQWLGLGLAPASFAVHLQIGYALWAWCVSTHNLGYMLS